MFSHSLKEDSTEDTSNLSRFRSSISHIASYDSLQSPTNSNSSSRNLPTYRPKSRSIFELPIERRPALQDTTTTTRNKFNIGVMRNFGALGYSSSSSLSSLNMDEGGRMSTMERYQFYQTSSHDLSSFLNPHDSPFFLNPHDSSTFLNLHDSSTFLNPHDSSTFLIPHDSSTFLNVQDRSSFPNSQDNGKKMEEEVEKELIKTLKMKELYSEDKEPPRKDEHLVGHMENPPKYNLFPPSNPSLKGMILNSYFAKKLLLLSIILVIFNIVSLVFRFGLQDKQNSCYPVYIRAGEIHYIGIGNFVFTLSIVFPQSIHLYIVGKAKLIRTPYLHLCELLVIVEAGYMLYYAGSVISIILQGTLFHCIQHGDSLEILLLVFSIATFFLVNNQIAVFCRSRSHIKLQLGASSEATHSANLQGWVKRIIRIPTFGKAKKKLKYLRTRIHKASVVGDINAIELHFQKVERLLGKEFPKVMYKCPTLWFWTFARSKKNPLHIACMNGNLNLVSHLLASGFDVNSLDKVVRVKFSISQLFKCIRFFVSLQDGQESPSSIFSSVLVSPLHVAVVNGHIEIVKVLIEHGADLNKLPIASFYSSRVCVTPIFLADNDQVLKLLLSKGANHLMVPGKEGSLSSITVLQKHLSAGHFYLSNLLEQYGADICLTPQHAAAAIGDLPRLKHLLGANVNPNVTGEIVRGASNRTPLHWAATTGQVQAVQLLLEYGAIVDALDSMQRSPLHWAARNNHLAVVQLLLQAGADPSRRDANNLTVISSAAQMEGVCDEIFRMLVDSGADINATMENGDTALHLALLRENRETAMALLHCGADIMQTNFLGKRAVDCTTSTEIQFAVKQEAGSRDIMLSYTHAHSEFALRIKEALEQRKLTVWMDTMNPSGIGAGSVWREEIAKGIAKASVMLSIVCDRYARSEWCLKELAYARIVNTPVYAILCEEVPLSKELQGYIPSKNTIPFWDVIISRGIASKKSLSYEIKSEDVLESLVSNLKIKLRQAIKSRKKAIKLSKDHQRTWNAMKTSNQNDPTGNHTVYICHTNADLTFVKKLCDAFHKKGYHSILDRDEDETMEDKMLRFNKVIHRVSFILLLLTNDLLELELVKNCLSVAATHRKPIVPILHKKAFLDPGKVYSLSRSPILFFTLGDYHRKIVSKVLLALGLDEKTALRYMAFTGLRECPTYAVQPMTQYQRASSSKSSRNGSPTSQRRFSAI